MWPREYVRTFLTRLSVDEVLNVRIVSIVALSKPGTELVLSTKSALGSSY